MADTGVKRRCPLWVKVLLGASLAGNLAVAGLVGGMALRGGPLGGKGPGMGYAMPYVLALPHEDRRMVFSTVRGDPDLPDRSARRAAYRDMVALLKADTLDRVAVEAVLERQSQGVSDVQAVAQSAWLDIVTAMPAEERKAYAQRVEEVASRERPNKPGKKD
ncbi:periplasmic heavy metal sensor [Tateyamaria omphalii]|uniref:periplasmic heavy metal sensor n=1 Tax=Tateyamaria omphalii TaxID=299262 RepID=UPI001C992BEE|nr:periplasmic heavy metal sensor [Tateyamaria omphalii]MBY5932029.1 periplasmic heavy metal sensor [Tateyamaria omphalii]